MRSEYSASLPALVRNVAMACPDLVPAFHASTFRGGQAGTQGSGAGVIATFAEKEVTVKSDLMVLSTLPRVLSVGETVEFPVTLFNTRDDIRSVTLGVSASGPVTVAGAASQTLRFTKAEELLAALGRRGEEATIVGRMVEGEAGAIRIV